MFRGRDEKERFCPPSVVARLTFVANGSLTPQSLYFVAICCKLVIKSLGINHAVMARVHLRGVHVIYYMKSLGS